MKRLSIVCVISAMIGGMLFTTVDLHAEDAHQLIGLWEAVRDYGPEIEGTLTVEMEERSWRASIAGYETAMKTRGDLLLFDVAADRGQFLGTMSLDSSQIVGHWIQPPTIGAFAHLASPVYLTRLDDRRWRGDVAPLDDKMTMFLLLYENENGTVSGVLRNPETNYGRFFDIGRVVIEDGWVRCLEPGQEGASLEGPHYPEFDAFSLFMPNAGGMFDFMRADDSASTFYPRPKSDAPYTYRIPSQEEDGWKTGSLADVGMATGPIEELINRIVGTPMDAIDAPYIHAVLIARNGTLVVEEYFHGYHGRAPHATRSASKSVTSTLVGMAIHANLPVSLSSGVYEVMYGGHPPHDLDPRKQRMTLKHLLTMTPGWDCFDGDDASRGNEERMQSQQKQHDWWQYSLDLPMVNEPGTAPGYCSGSLNLAGGVLTKATGMWLPDFYQKFFAAPLQTDNYAMNLMPTGEAYAGGGLYICPRDFLKMGQLFIDNGQWQGKQLISEQWAHDAIISQVSFSQEDYGYGWWIVPYAFEGGEVQAFYAGGNGGQYIIAIPELGLNIVFLAANFSQPIMHKTKREYVPEYILKSISVSTD